MRVIKETIKYKLLVSEKSKQQIQMEAKLK